jgi:hypothetical protein
MTFDDVLRPTTRADQRRHSQPRHAAQPRNLTERLEREADTLVRLAALAGCVVGIAVGLFIAASLGMLP